MLGLALLSQQLFSQADTLYNLEEELIYRVMDLSDEGRYPEALGLCDSILLINSEYDRLYSERAMIYLNMDKPELAKSDYEKLLALDPDYPGARNWYAKTLSDLGESLMAARVKLSDLRDLDSHSMGVSPEGWSECAQYYWDAGKIDSAKMVLEEYFKDYADELTYYRRYETSPRRIYAKLLLLQGEKEQALNEAQKTIESEYTVPADYLVLIEALLENNNMELARTEIDNYINNIQQGYETPEITELKRRLK